MQFIHLEEKKLVELETINENNQRLYVTPEGKKYPSVTTVLGWDSKQGILEWRKRVVTKQRIRLADKHLQEVVAFTINAKIILTTNPQR